MTQRGSDGVYVQRDEFNRRTMVSVDDMVFEREGIARHAIPQGVVPGVVMRAASKAAYEASPQAYIDMMREKKRRNYLRRFPWLRSA